MTDLDTTRWLRNDGDERAVANGCRFDVLRGAWTVYWIEKHCRLYEGEGYAGEPLILHGCHDCDHSGFYAQDYPWKNPDKSPGIAQEIHKERAELFAECVAAGHHIDWQYECFMRLFGWVRHSEMWKREVRRFKESVIFTAKKNKKSPSLAALGMYLLCGDGEPGAKVFLAAKDGDQARRNAAQHTMEMLRQSEVLKAECTPNRTTMQITHNPSRSVMYPLSSSNSRTQESKEGLNGSSLIDELHVVDRTFVDRISRAGISRPESLMAQFSTAGNNPDGYGKERCDYARDVMTGKQVDEELFAAVYEAPQDVTDEQLDNDFEKYARMANPSYGHTIDPQEIRRDYERSKVTIEKLSLCKMYRFNVWQHSSNPWLRMSKWMDCKAEFTEKDLLGQTCFLGVDLSLRWDFTALVLCFPWGDSDPPRFRYWPYLFIPEVGAKALDSKTKIRTWEKTGEVRITEGNITDFPLIKRTILEIADKFDLAATAYDERFAATMMQELQDEHSLNVVPFKQNSAEFTEPMGLFEGDVLEQRLEHPNNDCLNWMAGNATKGKNGLLRKPEQDDTKKFDGVVAAVMARAMAVAQTVNYSYYEHNTVEMG